MWLLSSIIIKSSNWKPPISYVRSVDPAWFIGAKWTNCFFSINKPEDGSFLILAMHSMLIWCLCGRKIQILCPKIWKKCYTFFKDYLSTLWKSCWRRKPQVWWDDVNTFLMLVRQLISYGGVGGQLAIKSQRFFDKFLL